VTSDYDSNPARYIGGREVAKRFGSRDDVHEDVAARFANEGVALVLDVGSADGTLARLLRGLGVACVILDRSYPLLGRPSGPKVLGDAARLPFADGSFSAVACLYMLYHLQEPLVAVSEAFRVLMPGGLFAAATVARSDSPELHEFVPPKSSPFDAEEAQALVGQVFSDIEIDRWDGPLLTLPDAAAVRDYLTGRQAPAEAVERAIREVRLPLSVTKRGVLVFGRKR